MGVYVGIMEKKMETTNQGLEFRVSSPPSVDRDIMGLHWGNGREDGNYYSGFRV